MSSNLQKLPNVDHLVFKTTGRTMDSSVPYEIINLPWSLFPFLFVSWAAANTFNLQLAV